MTGRIQLYVTLDALGADDATSVQALGSRRHRRREGTLFKTKTGELSVKVTEVRLLAKALRPLPEKFHGLADQEQRYRQRYVDLIINGARDVFVKRSQIVQAIREFFVAARLPRSRDADAAPDPRRRRGPAVHHASQRARHASCTCASRRSCT